MLRRRCLALLSSQWRPHSEQLKIWAVGTNSDFAALSVARDYVSNLDLQSTLQTFEDGIELASLLPAIKYPLGTQTMAKLSAHLEATAGELGETELRQIAANISLSPASVEYYDGALCSPGVMTAIQRCLPRLSDADLIEFAEPVWQAGKKGPKAAERLCRQVSQLVANELTSRLTRCDNKGEFLCFVASARIPLELLEMDGLVKALCDATLLIHLRDLQRVLDVVAAQRSGKRYAAWGAAFQASLIRRRALAKSYCRRGFINLLFTGTAMDAAVCRKMSEACGDLDAAEAVEVLAALKDNALFAAGEPGPLRAVQGALESRVNEALKQPFAGTLEEQLGWIWCLSFFSTSEAAALLNTAVCENGQPKKLSEPMTALVCELMISTGALLPQLLPDICQSAQGGKMSQESSVHALYLLHREGIRASPALVKRAVGRVGTRLVAARAADRKRCGVEELSPRDLALLIAGLCFIDDKRLASVVRRVVEAQELTLSAAVNVLRHVRQPSTASSGWAVRVALGTAVQCAGDCTTDELAMIATSFAEFSVRDAAAFRQLLNVLQSRALATRHVVAVAAAARSLKLTSVFEQARLVDGIEDFSGISPQDLVVLMSCSSLEQRQVLLRATSTGGSLGVTSTEMSAPELILRLGAPSVDAATRQAVIAELKSRGPLERASVAARDVVAALESTTSVEDVDVLCKAVLNVDKAYEEALLMRLLRVASRYPKLPGSFFRLAGSLLIAAAGDKRLTAHAAVAWLDLYVDHQVRDDGTARPLLALLSRNRNSLSVPALKSANRALRFFGGDPFKPTTTRRHARRSPYLDS